MCIGCNINSWNTKNKIEAAREEHIVKSILEVIIDGNLEAYVVEIAVEIDI